MLNHLFGHFPTLPRLQLLTVEVDIRFRSNREFSTEDDDCILGEISQKIFSNLLKRFSTDETLIPGVSLISREYRGQDGWNMLPRSVPLS